MSAIKSPVQVYVDEMIIHDGPGRTRIHEIQNYINEMGVNVSHPDHAKSKSRRIKLTLSTGASVKKFEREVVITSVEVEYEDWLEDVLDTDPVVRRDQALRAARRYKIKGYISNWHFTGICRPMTHKGLLVQAVGDVDEG